MKKNLLLILVIVCTNIYINAQTWPVYYGGAGIEASNKSTTLYNGISGNLFDNIILTGFTNSVGSGGKDMYVVKTDLNGNEILSKTYGSASEEVINSICPFTRFSMPYDPLFILGGYSTINGNKDIYVQEIDSAGNKVVDSTIFVNSAGDDELLSVKSFSEGYTYGVGYFTNQSGNKDFYFMKMEEMWSPITMIDSFTIGGNGSDIATSIDGDAYGTKCLAGYSNSFGSGDNDIYIVNYDEQQGVILWDSTYGDSGEDVANDILSISGGFYIVIGSTTSSGNGGKDVFIMKLDSYGNIIWQKTYGGAGDDEALNIGVQQGEFNNYIISGYTTSFGSGDKDAYLLKINLDGDTLWTKVFGQSGIDDIATTGIYNNCEWYVSGTSGDQMFLNKFAEPKIPLTFTTTNVSCYGGNDGYILLQIPTAYSNGMMSYNWSNGGAQAIGAENISLIAGTYTITVNDGFCNTIDSIEIFEPTVLTATHSQLVIGCYAMNDKSAVVTPSGGTSPYGYNWLSTGSSDSIATMLSVGIQNFEIWDSNGCTLTDTIAIFDSPSLLKIAFASQFPVNCPGDCNGSAKVIAEGGSYDDGIAYSYFWSDPASQTTDSISNLCTGGYSVTVTDGYQCTVSLDTIYIDEPSPTYIDFGSYNASCNGSNDGMIKLYYIAGFSPFTFNWSNGSTNDTLTSLTPGNYSVTVTNANGCTVDSTFTISEPSAIADNAVINDVSCNGYNDGSIKVIPSGGVAPYYYFVWSNGTNNDSISNLSAGNYSLTINDITGCLKVFNYTITEPSTLSSVVTTSNVACYGGNTGSATITPVGGTSPYNYLWSNGFNGITYYGFTAGFYSVSLTDANGCSTVNYSVVISQPSSALSASIAGTNVLCYGGSTGYADLTVSGGTMPYSYAWSNGTGSEDLNNIPAGTWSVTVTDANGCTSVKSITISQPSPINATITGDGVICYGDTTVLSASANGGLSPYSYLWSNAATSQNISVSTGSYTVTITDVCGATYTTSKTVSGFSISSTFTQSANQCLDGNSFNFINTGSSSGGGYTYSWTFENGTPSFSTLNNPSGIMWSTSGTFTVTHNVSHSATGCISTTTSTVTIYPLPTIFIVPDNITICEGQSTTLSASGGNTYLWNTGETTASIIVSPDSTTTFNVTASNANGCSSTVSALVNVNPLPTISGLAQYTGGTLDSGKVNAKLYSTSLINNIQGYTLTDSVINGADNKFYFTNVPLGEYIIKVFTTDNTYPTLLPTYYDTTLLSQYAIKLNAECGINQDIVVNMIELQTANAGTSTISGRITVATNNKSIMGEPIPGAEITLEQEPDDEPIANTETNVTGDYLFTNLANAEYSIIVDIPGFPQLETHTVIVNGDTNNINYVVDTDTSSSTFGIYIDTVTSISMYSFKNFSVNVYPNPFDNRLNIEFYLEQSSEVNVELIDITGKKIETLVNKQLEIGNYNNNYQLNSFVSGTYFIKMKVGNTVFLKKIMKK